MRRVGALHFVHIRRGDTLEAIGGLIATTQAKIALHAVSTDRIESIAQDQPQALDVAFTVSSAKCFVIAPEPLDGG